MGYFIINCKDDSFLIDTEDTIGNYIQNNRNWEEPIEKIYQSFIKENYRVVNIGANLGYHSVKMAKKVKLVHSFEPQNRIYNQFLANIFINDLNDKIIPHKLALGEKESMVDLSNELDYFDRHKTEFNLNGLKNNGGVFIKECEGNVKQVTLDSLNLEVDLILMDIEDYEYKAILGSKETLNSFKPVLIFECRESSKNQLFFHLVSLGYLIYSMNYWDSYIAIHPEFHDFSNVNKSIKETNCKKINFKIEENG